MANDGGKTSRYEEWMVSILAALQHNGKSVFHKAEVWEHQISFLKGGVAGFDAYAPFGFVSCSGGSGRQIGDNQLQRNIICSVLIGQQSKAAGICRHGNDDNLGTSKMGDLVIAAFKENFHPGEGFDCDDLEYDDEFEMIDLAKQHMIRIDFRLPWIT